MMSKLSSLVLFLGIWSCNSTPTASQYFDRKPIKTCITAFEKGYMFCNGKKVLIPPKMQITETVEDAEYFIDYFTNKEQRLYICLEFGDCK